MLFDRIVIKNYGCVRELDLAVSELHALIGPNDSGKSTILRAVRTALRFASGTFAEASGHWEPFDPSLDADTSIALEQTTTGMRYEVRQIPSGTVEWMTLQQADANHEIFNQPRAWNQPGAIYTHLDAALRQQPTRQTVAKAFGEGLGRGVRMVRLDPDSMREPSALITTGRPVELAGDRGARLAGAIDALRDRDDGSYEQFRTSVLKQFPHIESLGFDTPDPNHKTLRIKLRSGPKVAAQFMSEGLLYYMAIVALQYLEPVAATLVEEPENGLHPSRIKPVVEALRLASSKSQVLMATHSPLVINEMNPKEVSVITRPDARGTQAVRLDQTKNFAERAKVYATGELWLSYADGNLEAELQP